jgi:hypothetical protein
MAGLVGRMKNISDEKRKELVAKLSAEARSELGIAARQDTKTDAEATQQLTAATTDLEEASGVGGIAGYAGPSKKTGDKNDEQSIIRGA